MKRFGLIPLLIVVVLGLIFSGLANGAPAQTPAQKLTMKPMTLKFNNGQWAKTSPPGRLFKWFTDKVTERTNGLLKFIHFESFTLTKPGEEVSALQKGLADLGNTCIVYFPGPLYVNQEFFRCVPFGIADHKKGIELTYKMYYDGPSTLTDEYEKLGLKFLFTVSDAHYAIESKKPIRTLEDLKGVKIACIGGQARFLDAAGAVPVGMPVGERSQALQTGVIDASCVPPEIGFQFKLYEFAKHFILTQWGAGAPSNPISWEINKWNKLPPDIQKIIIATGKEAFLQYYDVINSWQSEAMAAMKKAGVTIYTPFSAEDINKWSQLILAKHGDTVELFVKDAEAKGKTGVRQVMEKWLRLQKEAGHKLHVDWGKSLFKTQ
jgi:TRAP-type C4-dicarboxylate transport system substrate-binding protein